MADRPDGPGLARVAQDDRLQADLDRALTDKLLARADVGGALARDLEASSALVLPALSDLDQRLKEAEVPTPQSRDEIESILPGSFGDIAMEGVRLNELLVRGGASLQQRSILKRGLLFLGKGLHAEAADWWMLNRPREPLEDPRFYCICTLLLAFTYQLEGKTQAAEVVACEAAKVHKLI